MMHWRRIDGVNEPRCMKTIPDTKIDTNVLPLMLSDEKGTNMSTGQYLKEIGGNGDFHSGFIATRELRWFMEIEPPEQPETPPSIIDTKKYGAE